MTGECKCNDNEGRKDNRGKGRKVVQGGTFQSKQVFQKKVVAGSQQKSSARSLQRNNISEQNIDNQNCRP